MRRTIMMGSDFYESDEMLARHSAQNLPRMGVGARTRIDTAIIDKNARVGDNCVISPEGKPKDADHSLYFLRDGIVIIPKNAVVPHGTKI